jgi:hypothetical protein
MPKILASACLLACLVAPACRAAPRDDDGRGAATRPSTREAPAGPAIELRAEIAATRVRAGDAVDVTIVLRNPGDELVGLLLDRDVERQFDLTVLDWNGRPAPPTAYYMRHVAPQKRSRVHSSTEAPIRPGEAMTFTCRINRWYDMTVSDLYTIEVGTVLRLRDGNWIHVAAPPLKVHVTD